MTRDEAQRIALFRYEIIAPLLALTGDGSKGELKRAIARLTTKTFEHPVRGMVSIGRGTLREWLYNYRKLGLDGLLPKARRDSGHSRAIDETLAEFIEELAVARPDLDGPGILAELRSEFGQQRVLPSLSSIYRFLRSLGLDQRRAPRHRDHRAYQFDLAGDCWQGDVMYGPELPTRDGRRKKTYLIAILDDATRIVPHAQFYYEQHLHSLKDCLKQALQRRGCPRRFYFDNGKIFQSRMLLHLAARLGIQLIHSRPYKPQGRAKIERWFLTVRKSFLARVETDRVEDLEELNRLLWAWVEGEYHQKPHRGLKGESPLDSWIRLSEGVRTVPDGLDLDELFYDQVTRRVRKDGTITLKGNTFEVGPLFISRRVNVRFDPFDLRRVIVQCEGHEPVEAFPVDLRANRRIRRTSENPPAPKPERPLKSLEDLANDLENKGKDETLDHPDTEDSNGHEDPSSS